jgi:cation diffusion facilitator family transporter
VTHQPLHDPHAENRARAEAGAKLVLRGIALNLALAAGQFAGGILGHTHALIADGVESLLDALSSLLVWAGFQVAAQPPDADHPYGHGKAEPLATLAVTVFTFTAAGWVAWRSIDQILTPHPVPSAWTLLLPVAVVALKVRLARRTRLASAEIGSIGLGVETWHHYADAVTSVLAFIGIAIAVIGGDGWEAADDWAALLASFIIAYNGIRMFERAVGDVMDTAVPAETVEAVRTLARTVAGVGAIDKCRVRKSGLSHLVDIHVCVDGGLTVRAGHDIAHAVKDALIDSSLRVSDVSVHIEPMK